MTSNVNGELSVSIAGLTEGEPSQDDPRTNSDDVYKSVDEIEPEDDQVFSGSDAISVQFQANDEAGVHLESTRLGVETLSSDKNLQVPNQNNNEVLRHGDGSNNAGGPVSSAVSGTSSAGVVPTTSTTRRPSYTSKAPSALNTLPGITISDLSSVRSSFDASHGSSHPPTQALLNHSPSRRGPTLASLQHSKEGGLASFQSSFDESIDGYSNPGTPSSVRTDSPTPSPSGGSHKSREAREKNRVSFKTKWDEAAKTDTLVIKCRETIAELHKNKLGSGSKGKCIKNGNTWFTPTEFEQYCGRGACKDWKRSIRYAGQTLQKLIEEGILAPHAVSCTCAICCGDDTLTGPVKLFVPYTKAKRKRRDGGGSVSKRFSTSGEDNPRDLHRARSFSMDSEVFPSLAHHHLGGTELGDDVNMPPMTPVTPMTPITPMTPFTPATPLTPLPRPGSPSRHLSLGVPAGAPFYASTGGPHGHGSPSVSSTAAQFQVLQQPQVSMALSTSFGRPPPTPTKSQASSSESNLTVINQHHWIQLEEMASSLISMAQQMKIMIEQAKVQAEALKESAVAQAKIQAESEKREAISQVRMQSIAQLSQALATAQAAQTVQNENKVEPGVQEQRQYAILKTCQNCSRDALLECTGCHRVYYCSQFCQRKDWINHQKQCGDQLPIASEPQPHQPPQQQSQHPPQQQTPPPPASQQGPPS